MCSSRSSWSTRCWCGATSSCPSSWARAGAPSMWWRTARCACPSAPWKVWAVLPPMRWKTPPSMGRSTSPSRNCSRPPALAAASSTACVRWALWVTCRKAVRWAFSKKMLTPHATPHIIKMGESECQSGRSY